MGFRGLKTTVISEGSVVAADSVKTSRVKLRFFRFSRKEKIWNVRLHARENYLSYALSTLRGIPPTKAIIIPWEIRELQPQVRPVNSTEVPQTSPRRRRGPFLRKT